MRIALLVQPVQIIHIFNREPCCGQMIADRNPAGKAFQLATSCPRLDCNMADFPGIAVSAAHHLAISHDAKAKTGSEINIAIGFQILCDPANAFRDRRCSGIIFHHHLSSQSLLEQAHRIHSVPAFQF